MTGRIAIACDHGGYPLKVQILEFVKNMGYEVTDLGCFDDKSVDYPVYAHAVCEKIQNKQAELGILICGTGIGMSMAANKHRGIRAACCTDTYSARLTRMHNDANVLCLGARVIGPGLACDIVKSFLESSFEGGRHQRRISMLEEYSD